MQEGQFIATQKNKDLDILSCECYKMFVIAPFSSLIDLRGASQEVGAYLIKDILLQSIVQWNVLATTL